MTMTRKIFAQDIVERRETAYKQVGWHIPVIANAAF